MGLGVCACACMYACAHKCFRVWVRCGAWVCTHSSHGGHGGGCHMGGGGHINAAQGEMGAPSLLPTPTPTPTLLYNSLAMHVVALASPSQPHAASIWKQHARHRHAPCPLCPPSPAPLPPAPPHTSSHAPLHIMQDVAATLAQPCYFGIHPRGPLACRHLDVSTGLGWREGWGLGGGARG